MINPEEILRSIETEGASLEENKTVHLVLGSRSNLNHIAGVGSGTMKIYPSIAKKFSLILSTPESLKILHPFEIRCVMCKKVISYPAWYYNIKYSVNHFHYFVCMNDKTVNANCYRRD
jgi:hypothetical protein